MQVLINEVFRISEFGFAYSKKILRQLCRILRLGHLDCELNLGAIFEITSFEKFCVSLESSRIWSSRRRKIA